MTRGQFIANLHLSADGSTLLRRIIRSLTLPGGMHFHATLGILRRSWLLPLLFLAMFPSVSAQQFSIPYLLAEDLYYSKAENILYATIREDSPRYPNSVALINPVSGHVITTIPVGSQPGIMASSDDGQFLYVVLHGSTSVRRIRLSSRTAEDKFPISLEIPSNLAGPVERRRTVAMKVVRGEPNTIVVSQEETNYAYQIGIAVYKDGKKLPDVLGPETGCNNLALGGDPQTIWCFDDEADSFEVQKLRIGPTGISREHVGPGWFLDCCFGGRLEYHDGLLYTMDGMVFDPESLRIYGKFSVPVIDVPTGDFAIDKDAGRIYFGRRYQYTTEIWEFNVTTFRPTALFVKSEENPGVEGFPDILVRCGPGGLAAIDSFTHEIVIFGLNLLKPFEPIVPSQPTWLDNGIRYISLPNTEIAYEPNTNRIFAAVPNVPGIGNSVVPIDASLLSAGEPIWIGSGPYRMAISGDGKYLYQSLWWANYMQRLDLTTLTPLAILSARSRVHSGLTGVSSLLVLPESNETLAIAREHDSLAIYHRGVPRPEVVTREHSHNSIIQLDSTGTRLYSLNTYSSNFELATNVITSEGVYRIPRAPGWIKAGEFCTDMKCQMDVCFTAQGEVIDVIQKKHLGRFSLPSAPFCELVPALVPDIHNRKVYYLLFTNQGVKLESWELDTFRKAETVSIDGVAKRPLQLIQTRSDEFAFSTGSEIGVIPKSALHRPFQVDDIFNAAILKPVPVAPGMIFSIVGSRLVEAEVVASSLPLPDELGGARVTIGERVAPLLSVSPNHINGLVPFSAGSEDFLEELVVTLDGVVAYSATLAVDPTSPGIFLHQNRRYAIALNEDDTINSVSKPALPGERIVIYFTGQGAVTPEIGDGHPAPTENLIMTKATTEATIGDTIATVEFSGLVGGFVGLAQAKLVVPDLDAGDHPVELWVGGVTSNAGLIVIGERR